MPSSPLESGTTHTALGTPQAAARESGSVSDGRILAAARAGITWLLQLQNRDGGIPTFCRGWGYLPFDRSSPDLTAHAVRAWTVWQDFCPERTRAIDRAIGRALRYLARAQRWDGGWVPLWFGNESAPGQENLTYGTTRVMLALAELDGRGVSMPRGTFDRALRWLVMAQNVDGGWGGAPGVDSSIEETALAVEALAAVAAMPLSPEAPAAAAEHPSARQPRAGVGPREQREMLEKVRMREIDQGHLMSALDRGVDWLIARTDEGRQFAPSPIGFYFARLWYSEDLYPVIFTVAALRRASCVLGSDSSRQGRRPPFRPGWA
jgi:squalene-hopene/tetraprenyl-beta-curcumene cyclase